MYASYTNAHLTNVCILDHHIFDHVYDTFTQHWHLHSFIDDHLPKKDHHTLYTCDDPL